MPLILELRGLKFKPLCAHHFHNLTTILFCKDVLVTETSNWMIVNLGNDLNQERTNP